MDHVNAPYTVNPGNPGCPWAPGVMDGKYLVPQIDANRLYNSKPMLLGDNMEMHSSPLDCRIPGRKDILACIPVC